MNAKQLIATAGIAVAALFSTQACTISADTLTGNRGTDMNSDSDTKTQSVRSANRHTHVTAPTQYVEVRGVRFAYRRFGQENGVPLFFLQHLGGGMDHWDPAVTDGLARGRPVILFDNAGVAGSSGETPETFEAAADYAAEFVRALRLPRVDILGFSIGGFAAQALSLRHPELVRRVILVGTGPRAFEPTKDPEFRARAARIDPDTGDGLLDDFLYLWFSRSPASQAAGKAFWERRHLRKNDVDRPTSRQTFKAHLAAGQAWREVPAERRAELKQLTQPTLVVSGSNDVVVPTVNSITLAQLIPNAQLVIYPDSGHGSFVQYSELFVEHARLFLDAP